MVACGTIGASKTLSGKLMPLNPAFFLLSDQNFKLHGYTLIRKNSKPYVLINLPEKSVNASIQFRKKSFNLIEHHLSVYKEYTLGSNAAISAFHYTAIFGLYIVHVYFDQHSCYLNCHVKLAENESLVELTEDEKIYFQRLSQTHINAPLNLVLESLKEKYQRSYEQFNKAIAQLEILSSKKMDQKYLSAITSAIQLLDEANNVTYNPDLGTRNILQSQAAFISNSIKGFVKNSCSTFFEESYSSSSQETIEHAEVTSQQLNEVQPEITELLNQLKDKKTKLLPAAEHKILNRLLAIIPPHNFNLVCQVINKKNALEKKRKDIISGACTTGDIATVKEMLDPNDAFFIQELVLKAFTANQEQLIYFLYDNYKFQKPKIFSKHYPVTIDVDGQPIKVILENAYIPLLYCAYEKNNFSLFCNIIDKYQENPNVEMLWASPTGKFISLTPLLHVTVIDNKLNYTKKLLESGADASKCEYHVNEWDIAQQKLKPCALTRSGTALHVASTPESVTLLLNYKADSTIRDSLGYSAYGREATIYPLNKTIIELYLATKKHSIDEPQCVQGFSPLYAACEQEQTKAADYFVQLGANVLHAVSSGIQGIKTTTPLALITLINQDENITKKMIQQLEYTKQPGARKEIQKILLMGPNERIKQILTAFYQKLCKAEAEHQFNNANYQVATMLYKEIFARCTPTEKDKSELNHRLAESESALSPQGQ